MDSVEVLSMKPFAYDGIDENDRMVTVNLAWKGRYFLIAFGLTTRGKIKIMPPTFEVHNKREHTLLSADDLPRAIRLWIQEMKPTLLIALKG